MSPRLRLRALALPAATFLAGALVATAVGVQARVPTKAATPTVKARPVLATVAPSVLALAATELRVAPSKQATVRLMATGRKAFVGLMTMQPGAAVPEHADRDEEYIHVLQGRGKLIIDGAAHEIGPGTTVFMPANARVSYVNGSEPLKALQVFAGPGSASKYQAWTPVKATAPAGPRRGRPGR